jgi:hypothetical protein
MNLIIVLGAFFLLGGLLLLGMAVFVYWEIQRELLEDNSGVPRARPLSSWSPSGSGYLIGGLFFTISGSGLIWYGIRSGSKRK